MLDNQPLVSVIVLTYNHSAYIRQALDSILQQKTTFPYEILVGDDASTDGTPLIIKEFETKFPQIIRPILRENNIGATKNLYDLLFLARGKYIACLEGDDFWLDSNKLQQQTIWLDHHPEYIGCYHYCRTVDEFGQELPNPKWVGQKERFSLKDFDGIKLPGHPSSWVYRNIYQNPRFDYSILYTAHNLIGDRTTALFLLAEGDFGLIPKIMSCYRMIIHKGGTNATSQIYAGTTDSKYVDFKMSVSMERYAHEVLHKNISFAPFRRKLMWRTLVKCAIFPSKERWQILKKMIFESKNKYARIL